ncbi:MAG: energy-coupled thiamine transporter ThiT [Ruminococcaceae bacterium]|nr:energy-coupled thiamine transporter ThiT [Oscillospiraceae bacterium]
MKSMSMTKKLTNSAIMIALSLVLSFFAVFKAPNGGDITIGSMVPVIVISFMYSTRWGIFTSICYTVLNMIFKGVVTTLPTEEISTYLLMILLDYILAFGVFGLAGFFYRLMGEKRISMIISSFLVTFLRYVCHFLSGIILWGSYAPEGQPVWIYSILYNGGYMIPEIIITTLIVSVLSISSIDTIIKKFS